MSLDTDQDNIVYDAASSFSCTSAMVMKGCADACLASECFPAASIWDWSPPNGTEASLYFKCLHLSSWQKFMIKPTARVLSFVSPPLQPVTSTTLSPATISKPSLHFSQLTYVLCIWVQQIISSLRV